MKAFLAGKRGICPDCDAKFIVPQHSGALAVPIDSEVPTSVEPPPVVPSNPLPPTIDQSLPDTWYVRPVSGEQYGPANTELMQSWVAQGRIAEDSWVWCTGWDQWKVAREVFETLKPTPSPAAASIAPDPPVDPSRVEQPQVEQPSKPKLRSPRSSSRKEKARRVSVALGTLVLLLAVALVMVLWYQN